MAPKTLRENACTFLGAVGPLVVTGHVLAALANLALCLWLFRLDRGALRLMDGTRPYLTRWHLARFKPWFRVFLHRIWRRDKDRDMHNHPWTTGWAFILWGGYVEKYTLDGGRTVRYRERKRWRLYRLEPDLYHRIIWTYGKVWTLFFAGPRTRDWGFLVDGQHVPSRTYLGLPEGHDFGD